MVFSWPIFLTVLFLGILQIAVGVVVGGLLPGRRSRRAPAEVGEPLHQLAAEVCQVVAAVAGDVSDHEMRLREASRLITSLAERSPASKDMLDTMAALLRLNEQLQARLADAERKLTEQAIQIETHFAAAQTDPLTRLPNRRAFDEGLLAALTQFHRHPSPCCLLWIDVDHFKRLNDRRGHLAGDHALRAVAERLRRVIGHRGLVARVGGEEFAVLLPHTAARDAQQLAEQIRAAVGAEELPFEQSPLRLTISAGVAVAQEGDDPVSMVRRADEALYAAKRGGRNVAYFHNGQICQRIESPESEEAPWREVCNDLRRRVEQLVKPA